MSDITSGGSISISLDNVENSLQDILSELQSTHVSLSEKLDSLSLYHSERYDKIEEWLAKFDDFFSDVYNFWQNFVNYISEHSFVIVGILLFFLLCFVIWLVYKLFRIFF